MIAVAALVVWLAVAALVALVLGRAINDAERHDNLADCGDVPAKHPAGAR